MRRANLRLYLEAMRAAAPRTILVGEAPSHRGCRLTGVPFMSERLMLDGIDAAPIFGSARGFRKATGISRPSTEASATIVWGTIGDIRPLPLLWNAFPFHPHHDGDRMSNRPPTARELEIGQRFLVGLIEIFEIPRVVAVGNRAHESLSKLRIDHAHVRHPSHGGKVEFADGIRRLCHNQACRMASGDDAPPRS